jgi:thiamine biosynthesis lipoprotein
MGSGVRVVVYARDQAHADRAAKLAFAEVAAVDASMSDYKPESELSRLSAAAGGSPMMISAPFFDLLSASHLYSEKSGGAFDVTIAPLVRLWRRSRKEKKLPSPEELSAARALVDYRRLELDPVRQTARLRTAGMGLDLGAIAKGYACDRALVALEAEGITRAMVETSGGYAFGDPPPGKDGWRIQVVDDEEKVLVLKRCGVATSGDTEQFVEIDGVRYSHIVDPATGLGLTNRAMVTVVAPDGMTADALSTTVSLLGPQRGLELAEKLDRTEALYRWVEGGRVRSSRTTGFSALLSRD